MTTLSLVSSIVLLIGFAVLSIFNAYAFFGARFGKHRNVSWIPLIGGFMGIAGFLLVPSAMTHRFWWLPALIDVGTIPGIVHAVAYHLTRARRLRK